MILRTGRVRISEEGINGTLWGSEHDITCYEEHARKNYENPSNPIDFKRSRGSGKDFEGLQVCYLSQNNLRQTRTLPSHIDNAIWDI